MALAQNFVQAVYNVQVILFYEILMTELLDLKNMFSTKVSRMRSIGACRTAQRLSIQGQ